MQKKKLKEFFRKILSEIFVDKYNCIVCDSELQEKSKFGLFEDCKNKVRFVGD